MPNDETKRLGTWESVKAVARSWRLTSVTLLMFSSSLPLGLVWIAVPAWMSYLGVNIKAVGLFQLAQAPWSFKFLWSPLLDRYPLPFLGRRRGWIFVAQIFLFVFGLGLAGVARHPDAIWVIAAFTLATAFASATQDIAYDGWTVEVLNKDEHGVAVAARGLAGRMALWLSGYVAITAAAVLSWPLVNLIIALCYLPLMIVTWLAPEPAVEPPTPPSLKEAVWRPFVGFLAQHRAVEILAFVVLFKLSDNLTQALLRPFFIQTGFGPGDVGVGTGSIGTFAIIAGTAAGGLLTQSVGLGRALWISGFLQIFSNLGYAVVAESGTNRAVLYGAQFFEMATSGLGTGAFMVLLLRLTQKRFSATQYALLTSLMSLSRVFSGPPAGLLVDALGWRDFFVLTVLAGIPGLVLLHRFVPWRVRDPEFHVASLERGAPLTVGALVLRAVTAGLFCIAVCLVGMALLGATRSYTAGKVKAKVVEVTPGAVLVNVRVAGTSVAGELTISDVVLPVPAGEFADRVPQSGESVTVVQEKAPDGQAVVSRQKAVERRFDFATGWHTITHPQTIGDGLTLFGIFMIGVMGGLAVAATLAARRGIVGRAAPTPPPA
jgi:MFS transporter, PAT family, beta-lactamase induction signal transducer AmpG